MTAHIELDLDEVRRLYVEEGLSLRQVGAALGVSHKAIGDRLDRLGIERRPARGGVQPKRPPKAELQRMYVRERLGLRRMAELLGVRHPQVKAWLLEAAIEIRGIGGVSARPIDDAMLRRWYVDQRMTAGQIAERLGLSRSAVAKWVRDSGYARPRGGGSRRAKRAPAPPTPRGGETGGPLGENRT